MKVVSLAICIILVTCSTVEACAWVLLEPPEDKRTIPYKPNMNAPLKEWTVASFSDTGSRSSYFDTKKECDVRRKRLAFAEQKGCFPVEELKRQK